MHAVLPRAAQTLRRACRRWHKCLGIIPRVVTTAHRQPPFSHPHLNLFADYFLRNRLGSLPSNVSFVPCEESYYTQAVNACSKVRGRRSDAVSTVVQPSLQPITSIRTGWGLLACQHTGGVIV